MTPHPTASPEAPKTLSEAKMVKTNLEVESLRDKKKLSSRIYSAIKSFAPLVTVIIAVVGLWSESAKNRESQRQERELRVLTQIRTNLDQLLQFPQEDNHQTVSRAVFLFEDLKNVFGYKIDGSHTVAEIFPNERKKVNDSLLKLIELDCNFDRSRDIGFDEAAIEHWNDYTEFLVSNPDKHDYILYKYTQALSDLHDRVPKFCRTVELPLETGRFEAKEPLENSLFNHFDDLIDGLLKHVKLLERNPDVKKRAGIDFQIAMCNPVLTEQIFKQKFDLSANEKYIKHCSEVANVNENNKVRALPTKGTSIRHSRPHR